MKNLLPQCKIFTFLSFRAYRKESVGACSGGEILLQTDVAFFAILDETTVVEVVFFAAGATGGDAAGRHCDGKFGIEGIVLASHAVGTLCVVGHKTAIGLGVERLETDNDAVVESEDVVGLALHLGDRLMGGVTTLVALEVEDKSTHARLPDSAEDAARIDIHGRGQRGVEVYFVVVGETAGPGGVLAVGIARCQQQANEK